MKHSDGPTRRQPRDGDIPGHIVHDDFTEAGSEERYCPTDADLSDDFQRGYMPDEVTRDHARRMHYAAHRWANAQSHTEADMWQRRYLDLRDRIVLGNRKLSYKAVRRRMTLVDHSDDLIGECYIVMIQAVAAYNPWLGIRFSTYAYTCLIRALSRQYKKICSDWLTRSVSLDSLADGGPSEIDWEPSSYGDTRLEEFLRHDHPLLSDREKLILTKRFRESAEVGANTLEKVGEKLGLSKERVRQVQSVAIGKLRAALAGVN